jgi:hypothetical protein
MDDGFHYPGFIKMMIFKSYFLCYEKRNFYIKIKSFCKEKGTTGCFYSIPDGY